MGDLAVLALLDDVRLDGHALIGHEDLDQLARLDTGPAGGARGARRGRGAGRR